MYLATVCSATPWPNRASSDSIRGAPHVGFSRDIRRIRSRISRSIGGRPGLSALDFHFQYSRNPIQCHLTTVSGWTRTRADRQLGQRRESHTRKTRSRGRSFGRLTDCLNTATCCRRARFSTAAATRPMMNALRNRKWKPEVIGSGGRGALSSGPDRLELVVHVVPQVA